MVTLDISRDHKQCRLFVIPVSVKLDVLPLNNKDIRNVQQSAVMNRTMQLSEMENVQYVSTNVFTRLNKRRILDMFKKKIIIDIIKFSVSNFNRLSIMTPSFSQ